jgi:hypothetical protein
MQQAARGQRPPLVGEEVRKEDIGKVESWSISTFTPSN